MVDNLIIHNLRSAHNVGSILRTADGFGVQTVYIGGTSPYPRLEADSRLPHLAEKQNSQIAKTALGAEKSQNIIHYEDIVALIKELNNQTLLVGLEQGPNATLLNALSTDRPISLLIGNEVLGISVPLQELCDALVEIPMLGRKESFNVSVATGIALYALSLKK